MKEWKPLIDFKKADFPFQGKDPRSEKKELKSSEEIPKKQIKKWQPPTIESLNQSSSSNTKKVIQGKQVFQKPKNDLQLTSVQKAKQDMTQMYINNSVKSNPIITIDIIRKWYWEKQPNAHKKIFILLRTLTKENLLYLMQYFTLIEKKQLVEIYKKNFKVDRSEILLTRQEFMNLMNELS